MIIAFVGGRLTALSEWLHGKLVWLEFHHLALAGVLLGLMVCCDLGGAIGKTAIAFGTVGVSGVDPSKFNPAPPSAPARGQVAPGRGLHQDQRRAEVPVAGR
ncbi:hypothetical protein [Streptomyces sp. NPDC005859]|uniref:hypothetical protein n=1 Tax=Streptomyces sp. NPDC005859 TaxID=3157170 RepID=UPI0033E4FC71